MILGAAVLIAGLTWVVDAYAIPVPKGSVKPSQSKVEAVPQAWLSTANDPVGSFSVRDRGDFNVRDSYYTHHGYNENGCGTNPSGETNGGNAVPEPTTAVLVGLGFAGALYMKRQS